MLYFVLERVRGRGPVPRVLFQFRFVGNRQFLTTLFPAACQYFTAIGSLHALTKTVNVFAAASMWLERTFHSIDFVLLLSVFNYLKSIRTMGHHTYSR